MKRIFSLLLAVSFVLTLLVPFTGVVVHKLASTVFLLLCLVHTVASRKKKWAPGAGLCWAPWCWPL